MILSFQNENVYIKFVRLGSVVSAEDESGAVYYGHIVGFLNLDNGIALRVDFGDGQEIMAPSLLAWID